MKRLQWMFASLLLLATCNVALAQTERPAESQTLGQVMDGWVVNVEKKIVSVADAMPAEKYSFAPSRGEFKGVRTFGEQLKHVAAANYSIGSHILGVKPPADAENEAGPDSVRTKAEIIQYLKDSFALLHQAMASINEKNATEPPDDAPKASLVHTRLGLAVDAIDHSSNHYGQMVEYLRMNGIVPPASRPGE